VPPPSYEPVIASPGAQCPFCEAVVLVIDSKAGLVPRPGVEPCAHFERATREEFGVVLLKFLRI
jgi:hypothetical protein